MVKLLKPAIERRYDTAESGIGTRKRAAEDICRFLEVNPKSVCDMPLEREYYYNACKRLLEDRDSERILLYLPLRFLEDAPVTFKKAYCDAWYRLLSVKDVRENFHIGDCFEVDARPHDGLERVVKCAHLAPWLLKYGYISKWQVLRILKKNSDDEVLLQSFKDTWEYIRANKILGDKDLRQLTSKTAHLPARKKPEPLYISKKRLEWLDERNKPSELLTPTAKLEGPFSNNICSLEPQLDKISSQLEKTEIIIVGGSRLKGYGTTDSDLDIWTLRQLEIDPQFRPGSPHAAHIYFNTIWLGGETIADELEHIADRIIGTYTDSVESIVRRQAIERLESDLLQYRLLHKGFSRFAGINEFCIPPEMDGDCPFYCDEYRRIATMLYAKYVWL